MNNSDAKFTHEKSVLQRLRDGLRKRSFNLVQVEEVSGIPHATLRQMRRDDWQAKTFDRLAKLEAALNTLAHANTPEDVK